MKDCEDKNKWVIDEVAAPIVRRIFRMTLEGYEPYQIAKQSAGTLWKFAHRIKADDVMKLVEKMRKKEAS